MDLLRLFSRTRILRFDRKRSILIDIDDIFVAPEGLKMNKNDVQALVQTQEKLRSFVPGLTFNLGFCGAYYKRGTPAEVEGSHELVRRSNNFQFAVCTMSSRDYIEVIHTSSCSVYCFSPSQNTSIAVGHGYSVSPHHSGVYPVYPPLYETWGRIWNITMTTTEEYPNIYPEHLRRGFIHRGIMVLPRQTCRLFTHTISYETFPGGKEAFHEAGNGGTVFNTLLFNPISIFMTHVTNYATDRLTLQLFSDLFQFTRTWTNLELTTDRPLNLGKRYFEIFPEDKVPIWGSPCGHKRHIDIYPPSKNCSRLPSLLILGPQKSGTTALYTFLKEHPLISANKNNKDHYEEVQFFSNETLYNYGIEWYMEQFPVPRNNQVIFEKSATYFTHPLAPKRVKALLPNIKLVVILLDPVNRAYSWYQHMQAHNSPVALKYTFSEVIGSNSASNITDRGLLSLRQHCLSPGQYQRHLNLWLDHFLPEQLLLIDGETLAIKPSIVMETVQEFLNLEMLDYNEILKWNSGKGFYCVNNHCLGPSKGRKYPDIAVGDLKFLEQYYRVDNVKLAQLLRRHVKTPIPDWLTTQLSAIRS
ncbi:bifunctional heparan sulfate N-deacetylase/N-sulfotransferase 1-like [Halichondria panicea]|uniref:bifunctional heparan sulfate N-deacetylase/N-sulfotransferase 1-like n=1 Tax=Halichondria panicea TaxID=6063 RepID=UPI00312B6636